MIPLKINNTHLYQIFSPSTFNSSWTEEEIQQHSISEQMFPTEVYLTSETYSRDAERTADYELESLMIVNRKAKPEFTWSLIRADYVENLLKYLKYTYNFKDATGTIKPKDAANIYVTYRDFTGLRTIKAYLGQTLEGTLIEYNNALYWQNFRLAFHER